MSFKTKKTYFFWEASGVFWCQNRCQKCFLYKISHRYWYSKKNLTQKFPTKKNILKIKKYVFWKFSKFQRKNENSLWQKFTKEIFIFPLKIWNFWKTYFTMLKIMFLVEKKNELEKFSNINIDVKFYRDSIFGIYLGIRALLMPLWKNMFFCLKWHIS